MATSEAARASESEAAGPATPVGVDSETGRLRRVIVGSPDGFELPGPINAKLAALHEDHPDAPTPDALRPEFDAFVAALAAAGVEVVRPERVPGIPDQLTPRDIGFVVGDTFVVARMGPPCRREEWRGIRKVLDRIPADRVLRAPDGVVVEGGDVIVDRGALYVGVGQRTNAAGAAFLRARFGDRYDVRVVPLSGPDSGEDVLHLDCAFVPVGAGHALVYPAGLREIPERMRRDYAWIEVDRDEQRRLATNVLSIGPDLVVSRPSAARLNAAMRGLGIDVIELRFRETPKCGGSFRCASLPLNREPA